MSLNEKLRSDMTAALKQGDTIKLSALRMVIADVRMLEISKNIKTPNDGDILQIIQKQIKQRKDSVSQFEKGERKDLADKERSELAILESYMPAQLTEDEIAALVKETIAETGLTAKSDMGKIMKIVSEKAKGRSDGRTLSQIVMRLLK